MKKTLLLTASHGLVALAGFAAGIYTLPLLIAPPAPADAEVQAAAAQPLFSASFRRDLEGSDPLHWGEGQVTRTRDAVLLQGRLAPGPDYKLYLSPEFVQTKADFLRLKSSMRRVGDVKTFHNFVVPLPSDVDPAAYRAVIVWCESFSAFITAAQYR
jgi:hypothetical protein